MKVKLTKRPVEAIKPVERDVPVWDAEIPCFGGQGDAQGWAIPTMRGLADRCMAEHAFPKKKACSADSDNRLIDCHLLPLLGDRQVSDIARADLRRFMQDIAGGKTRLDQKAGLRGWRIVRGGKGRTATAH